MENARNISISNCEIYQVGSNAIYLLNATQNVRVIGNYMHNLGYNGVHIYGYILSIHPKNRNHHIIGNHIHDIGQLTGDGGGVLLFISKNNTITHNLIYNSNRYGINLTGFHMDTWTTSAAIDGYPATLENTEYFVHTNDNVVAFNDCHTGGLDSSDLAPLNFWAIQAGNIVYNNHSHNSSSSHGFHFGLYFDAWCNNTLVKNNLIDRFYTDGGVLHAPLMLKGLYNVIDNNFFVDNPDSERGIYQIYSDDSPRDGFKVSRNNIFYNSGDNMYHFTFWQPNRLVESDFNLYHNYDGIYRIGGGSSPPPISEWVDWLALYDRRYDQHSTTGQHPQFMESAIQDYRLKYTSPAHGLGIVDINQRDIGLPAGYAFADTSEELKRLFVREEGFYKDRSFADIPVGGSAKINLTARTKTGFAIEIDPSEASFAIVNPRVASIDRDGVITGLSEGVAEITITLTKNNSTVSTTYHVLVGDRLVGLSLNAPTPVFKEGQEYAVHLVGLTKLGRMVVFNPLDASISADDGVVGLSGDGSSMLAKSVGTGSLEATVIYGAETMDFTIPVEVVDSFFEEAIINVETNWLTVGDAISLEVAGINDNGAASDMGMAKINFIADGISMVAQDGEKAYFTADKVGIASVTAEVEINGIIRRTEVQFVIQPVDKPPAPWHFINFGQSNGFAEIKENGEVELLTDGFSFLYQEIDLMGPDNDFEISAVVQPFIQGTGVQNAIGIMVCDSLLPDANYVFFRLNPTGRVRVFWQNHEHPLSNWVGRKNVSMPTSLSIFKEGDIITAMLKEEGGDWVIVGKFEVPFEGEIAYAGIAVVSVAEGEISYGRVLGFRVETGG